MLSKRIIFALLMVVIMVSGFGLDARAAGTVTIDWIRQFGTPAFDFSEAITLDNSGVYAVGNTSGTLPGQTNAGSEDAYIRKYDFNGSELWTASIWRYFYRKWKRHRYRWYWGIRCWIHPRYDTRSDFLRYRRRLRTQIRCERERIVDAPVWHQHT